MYPVERPKRKAWIWIVCILAVLILIFAAAAVFLFVINKFTFVVEPLGKQEIVLDYGETFRDDGASVKLYGSIICKQEIVPDVVIEVLNDVDTGTVGNYKVVYQTSFLCWKASAERTVKVVDRKPPEITLVSDPDAYTIPGEKYAEEGFTAVDEYDGDLTDRVECLEKDGQVTYVVTDSSGNRAEASRIIRYFDPIPPEIVLLGDETMYIDAGDTFVDPGFKAQDNCNGDLTEKVTVEGTVNRYCSGTYTLNYSVSDSYGNSGYATRTVVVVAKPQPSVVSPSGNIIYLTFDDGPSGYTDQLLGILRKYNVKATFFVVNRSTDIMKRIVNDGHAIGMHSMTHEYSEIYAGEDAFFADLLQMQDVIYNATGVKTTLMRFPGGSSNSVSSFNEGIMTRLTQAVRDMGFQYFDWNVDSMDAGGAKTKEEVAENVISRVQGMRYSVVLQHDTNGFSVEAVEDIIIWGLANGYTFLPLSPSSPVCHHNVNN